MDRTGDYPPSNGFDVPDVEEDFEDEEVQVDFSPKEALEYKLPSLQLFAPDETQRSVKEKKIVRENIKILERNLCPSFGIKVTVERAEIGPSVTRDEVKPAVGVRVNQHFQSGRRLSACSSGQGCSGLRLQYLVNPSRD